MVQLKVVYSTEIPPNWLIQLLAIVVIGAYSLIMTLIIGKVIDKTIGLRVEEETRSSRVWT